MFDDCLIYEYRQTLIKPNKSVSTAFFPKEEGGQQAEKNARILLKYAIEDLLGWSPTEMQCKFNRDIADRMHLTKILKYISTPPEIDKENDYDYYAHYLYPKIIKFDLRQRTILVLKKVQNGEIHKFPRGFFDDNYGEVRAITCLNYVIGNSLPLMSIDEMYEMFSNDSQANIFLEEQRLILPRRLLFDTCLDYFHSSLCPSEQNNVLYHFYRFRKAYNAGCIALRKEKKKGEKAKAGKQNG